MTEQIQKIPGLLSGKKSIAQIKREKILKFAKLLHSYDVENKIQQSDIFEISKDCITEHSFCDIGKVLSKAGIELCDELFEEVIFPYMKVKLRML